jgi:hypothetical protein
MAQEQVKSPTVIAVPGADKDEAPAEATTKSSEIQGSEEPQLRAFERSAETQKRSSLTERLRAEQHKTEPKSPEPRNPELRADDNAPLDLTDGAGPNAPKPITRSRRPAGPAQRRIAAAAAANDDLPSIGGLIFALQQRPSRSPFIFALFASITWFIIGGFFAFGLISSQLAAGPGAPGLMANPSALTAAMTILVPIAIFWFLALLVWRAQELRLMASAMTEVAVRLAEPDKLAEQSVASLGQTIRRQVAAMNDAISRAIGRASELEALVHNEVAALERSYGENEVRVRGLISELASEREALANNSQRVSEALKGVGAQVTRDISAASGSIDKKLAERGLQLTDLLVTRSNEAAEQVQKAQARVAEHVPALLERLSKEQTRLGQVIDGAAKNLSALENVVGERTAQLDKTLKERTEALTASLATRIKSLETTVSQGALILDKTLKDRTDAFAATIGQNASALDKTLKDRTDAFAQSVVQNAAGLDKALQDRTTAFTSTVNQSAIALDKTLAERTQAASASLIERLKAIDGTFGHHVAATDKMLGEHTKAIEGKFAEQSETLAERTQAASASLIERLKAIDGTFGHHVAATDKMLGEHTKAIEGKFAEQSALLNQVLATNSTTIRQTADQVGAQSKEAVGILTNQTQALRDVSRGLLEQIHSLTQRFEHQGQAILTAAKALDSSNTKIDSILESRHQSIIGLLHTVNTKAQDLDNVMRSYAGIVEGSLVQAETRAKQVGAALARDTAGQAQQALAQIERLREEAQAHTARAVGDLKGSFETVMTQIGRQLEQMRGQFDHTSHGMREAARQTATDLDQLRQEMQRRMESLPQQTAQATAAIRKALSEQLKEIEAITPVLARAGQPGNGGSLPPRAQALPYRGDEGRSSGDYDLPPLPRFDARGRQAMTPEPQDLGSVADNLAQQLSSASSSDRRSGAGPLPGQPDQRMQDRRPEQRWSVGDLLSRASEPGEPAFGGATQRQDAGFGTRNAAPTGGAQGLRLDEIARAIDTRTAAEVWQRFRAGERGVLGRHLYSVDGQTTFDEISRRYDGDSEFRGTVDRYMGDFERLLGEAEQADPQGRRMMQNYLTSETGRVYLLLAHASGRLR